MGRQQVPANGRRTAAALTTTPRNRVDAGSRLSTSANLSESTLTFFCDNWYCSTANGRQCGCGKRCVKVRDRLSMHMATPVIIDLDMTKVRDVLEHARAALSDED